MPDYTAPLGFPMPNAGDRLDDTIYGIPRQLAQAVNDYLAALAAVAPVNWTAVAVTGAGWAATAIEYARRAGMVTVNLDNVTKANFAANEVIAILPAGFRPSRTLRFTGEWSGASRWFAIDTAGQIIATVASTNGIKGTATFPV